MKLELSRRRCVVIGYHPQLTPPVLLKGEGRKKVVLFKFLQREGEYARQAYEYSKHEDTELETHKIA